MNPESLTGLSASVWPQELPPSLVGLGGRIFRKNGVFR